MTYQNPHMLPKVRSADLTESANWHKFGIGCTARVSSFIPGHRCSSDETTVFAHYGSLGKGTGTKTSDINGVVACLHCHDLIDGRDDRVWWIIEKFPRAFYERLWAAGCETRAHWVRLGLISGTDWSIV